MTPLPTTLPAAQAEVLRLRLQVDDLRFWFGMLADHQRHCDVRTGAGEECTCFYEIQMRRLGIETKTTLTTEGATNEHRNVAEAIA